MKGRTQTLLWLLWGEGVKTTENKIHWPRWYRRIYRYRVAFFIAFCVCLIISAKMHPRRTSLICLCEDISRIFLGFIYFRHVLSLVDQPLVLRPKPKRKYGCWKERKSASTFALRIRPLDIWFCVLTFVSVCWVCVTRNWNSTQPGRWLVTTRLGTGKSLTFFYSVPVN